MRGKQALLISGIDGFCHRYAVLHRADHLRRFGIDARIRHFADSRIAKEVESVDFLFVYRVPETTEVLTALETARDRGMSIIGLLDDLIFLGEAGLTPSFLKSKEARDLWCDGARRYRATLELCDAVLVASEPLLRESREVGWQAFLHPDALADEEMDLADAARCEAESREPAEKGVVLGYFSGTPTHDHDFAQAAAGLQRAMASDDRLTLRVWGEVALPSELDAFEARIERRPFVPWVDLPGEIAEVDINLAPIDWRNRFATAKGATKFMEAGAVAVPTIASPTESHRAVVRHGENALLADDADQWCTTILELAAAPRDRREMGQRALQTIRGQFGARARAEELRQILEGIIESLPRVPARTVPTADVRPLRTRSGRTGRVSLAPDAFPALAERPMSGISPPLSEGLPLRQAFRCRSDEIVRVDVLCVTYAQDLEHFVTFRLCDEEGEIVATWEREAAQVLDHTYVGLEAQDGCAWKGRNFTLEIRASGTGVGNALSFGLNPEADDCPAASLAGESLDGALALRAFARWQSVRD